MQIHSVSPYTLYQQRTEEAPEESSSSSCLSWLNPCTLVGRICDNWEEIALIAVTAVQVAALVIALIESAFVLAITCGVSAALLLYLRPKVRLNADQRRQIQNLTMEVLTLKGVRKDLVITTKGLQETEGKLKEEVKNITDRCTDLGNQVAHFKKQIETLLVVNRELKETTDKIHNGLDQSIQQLGDQTVTAREAAQRALKKLKEELIRSEFIAKELESVKGNTDALRETVKDIKENAAAQSIMLHHHNVELQNLLKAEKVELTQVQTLLKKQKEELEQVQARTMNEQQKLEKTVNSLNKATDQFQTVTQETSEELHRVSKELRSDAQQITTLVRTASTLVFSPAPKNPSQLEAGVVNT